MAQAPKQQHQVSLDQQPLSVEQNQDLSSSIVGSQNQVKQGTNLAQVKKSAPSRAAARFDRSSTQRASKVLVTYPLESSKDTARPQVVAQQHQPSKVFKNKCRTELKLLLEAIKPDYHEEIKNIYNDETYADFNIKIGNDEVKKPFHKCIIASRAFKFYSALKGFKVSNLLPEKDIIVHELQSKNLTSSNNLSSSEEDQSEAEKKKAKEERLRESLEIIYCILPENLIKSELLLNFFRRIYLDQDIYA